MPSCSIANAEVFAGWKPGSGWRRQPATGLLFVGLHPMAAAPPWQCLLDTGTWLEPRLSPVVTLDNLTAGECCSACIQAQHCATFELSAGRCHLSGNRSVSAAGTEPTRGVVLTVSYERAASPATRLPRLRRRRRRLLQLPCLTWAPFSLGALYSSCAPQDSTARRCTDFLGAARRAACMTPQLPPARLAMQECGGRRPIALRIAQANACYKVENTPDMAWVLAQPKWRWLIGRGCPEIGAA